MPAPPNHLINESSPYLLQHAHNPVDWYPWGEEALLKAVAENKPILLSIGYSACHWCHVMERESFEDEKVAAIMNRDFVNIKIDREERPDLDHIYMDAVQAMTGSGGWPLNVFLTPDRKPFYGGTYFPPQPAFNRPSWTDVLTGVSKAFNEKRHEIDAQAENLTAHLLQSNSFGLRNPENGNTLFTKEKLQEAVAHILKTADKEWGGFGRAPKFPQTFTIKFLLRYHQFSGDDASLRQALLSLDKMMQGGIYDHLGGGFARYSTDATWLAPHFEKMLYDNALLVDVFCEAYQLTRQEKYRQVVEETMAFVQREMIGDEGGFYAALDADSEGEEGKYYVWDHVEVTELLGGDAGLFCRFYDINAAGNWEGVNILRIKQPAADFCKENELDIDVFQNLLQRCKQKLVAARNQRVRPGLDDKVILGWNALLNSACSHAFAATGNENYRELAVRNMQFLLENFIVPGQTELYHTWKNDKARYPAFLDDYAYLIRALIHLQEITADTRWLEKATALAELVKERFSEQDTPFFYYTKNDQQDVIIRKKEVYDGAVPSGNAVMATNLHRLSILLDRKEWRLQSREMLLSLGNAVLSYPGSFAVWAGLWLEIVAGTDELAIVGEGYESLHKEVLALYLPHRILMAAKEENAWPLLAGKKTTDNPLVFFCRDYTCQKPVDNVKALTALINRAGGG